MLMDIMNIKKIQRMKKSDDFFPIDAKFLHDLITYNINF